MKLLFLLFASAVFFFSACSSKPSFEGRVQKFMKDSVVPNFNDPASYEYVSMSIDSVTNHSVVLSEQATYLEDLKVQNEKMHTNTMQYTSDKDEFPDDTKLLESDRHIDSLYKFSTSLLAIQIAKCDEALKQPDSLHHLQVKVKCRGKNKMGGLVLNDVDLKYIPSTDKIVQ